ncbi:MAG: hypothetical protein U0798_16070 [Gemmataceae bacterium]
MADPFSPEFTPPPEPEKAARPATPTASWQTAAGEMGAKSIGKTKAFFGGSLLFVCVAGAIVGLIMLLRPPVKSYFVSIPFQNYDYETIATCTKGDTNRLIKCFPESSENAWKMQDYNNVIGKLDAIAKGQLFEEWNDDFVRGINHDRPFIFHIAGYGVVDEANQVYLLPGNAKRDDPKTWISIDLILHAMEKCQANHKLLILDLGRSRANPFVGPLADDVPVALDAHLKKISAKLPCSVLVSCSEAGEESLIIPEMKMSAFAFYLAEGLDGAADCYNKEGKHDRNVNVEELATYVTTHVTRWARNNRHLKQTPKLYSPDKKDDFVVVYTVPHPVQKEDAPIEAIDIQKINNGRLLSKKASYSPDQIRRAGGLYSRWESAAIRSEWLLMSSDLADVPDVLGRGNERGNVWLDPISKTLLPYKGPLYNTVLNIPIPAASPAAAPASAPANTPPAKDIATSIRVAFDSYAKSKLVPQSEGKRDEAELAARATQFENSAAGNSDLAARIVWEWFGQEYRKPSFETVKFISQTMKKLLLEKSDTYVEFIALNRVLQIDRGWKSSLEGQAAIGQYFDAVRASSVILARGPTGFAQIANDFNAVVQELEKAEQGFLTAKFEVDAKNAGESLRKVVEKFQTVDDRLQRIVESRQVADDAIRILSSTASAFAESDVLTLKDWLDLATQTTKLANETFVSNPMKGSDSTRQQLVDDVKLARDRVLKPFQADAIKSLVFRSHSAKAQDIKMFRAVLSTSLLGEADRVRLWNDYFAITKQLHEATRKLDLEEYALGQTIGVSSLDSNSAKINADRRAEVAIALLRVAGHPDVEKAQSLLTAIRNRSTTLVNPWFELSRVIRNAYLHPFSKPGEKPPANPDWESFDRLARSYPMGVEPERPESSFITIIQNATINRSTKDQEAYRQIVGIPSRKTGILGTGVPENPTN